MKKQILGVLEFVLSILKKYDANKTHNMSSLMLNPGFESLCLLILSCIGHESVLIVKEYDKRSLYPMFIKCHNHFNHVLITKVGWANQIVEENYNLDIFQQIGQHPKLVKELMNKKLQIFKRYQVGIKDIKCFFNGGRSTKSLFLIVHQILSIFRSQIETKRIFSFINILTNLKICHLQMINLKKLIFVIKNWPNFLRVGYKSPSNLV
jgi:hypothetical protein